MSIIVEGRDDAPAEGVGALIGGFVMSFFGAAGFTGFNLWSFLVALIGSIILIAVINLLTGKRA